MWSAATGTLIATLPTGGWVHAAVFSPDGTRIATASADHTAQLWDAASGKPLFEALVHDEDVRSVAFSADGTLVVTASADRTARVWDAETGRPCSPPLAHPYALRGALFSTDGTRVVTTGENSPIRFWEFPRDHGTLEQWARTADLSPYSLIDGSVKFRKSHVLAAAIGIVP